MFKKYLKNQKGLTLIELLAVVVILGIIAAIAVPSIGKLIDNSRVDAHIANAQQMINSTKLAIAGNDSIKPPAGESRYVPLAYLEGEGLIDLEQDPDGGAYAGGGTTILKAAPADVSYVRVENVSGDLNYYVRLVGSERGIVETAETLLDNRNLVQ